MFMDTSTLPGLRHHLGADIDALREAVRDFAQREIAPHAATIDREDRFPDGLWPQLGVMGLLGPTVHGDWGGTGLGYLAHLVIMEELSRASASVALSYGAHSNLCVNQIHRHGTPEQKRRFLPPLISGAHVGALAMSEPEAGSDVVSMRLQARAQGDEGFVLTGSKMWITNGPVADTLVVYAKTDVHAGAKGITAFIVERGMPGFSVAQRLDKLGMRGSPTGELVFDGVMVPRSHVLGEVNAGVRVLMSGLDTERAVLAGGPLGIMQAVMDTVLPYVHSRRQFGQAIGEFQLVQAKLADMYVAQQACRCLAYTVARNLDETGEQGARHLRKDCAALILHAAEQATRMAGDGIQLLGGNGYLHDYDVGRLWRDAKLYEIGAGTSEIRRMLIGRELFEASA